MGSIERRFTKFRHIRKLSDDLEPKRERDDSDDRPAVASKRIKSSHEPEIAAKAPVKVVPFPERVGHF